MVKKYWTAAGIARLAGECAELTERLALYPQTIADARSGRSNSFNEDGLSDANSVIAEGSRDSAKLTDKLNLLATVQPVPVPTHTRQAQVGHLIRVRKEDGTEFVILLGGEGEVNLDSEYPTYSCTAPLGMAVKGRSVGDHAEVHTTDKDFDIEIVAISIPAFKKLPTKTPA